MLLPEVSRIWDALKIGPEWLMRPLEASAREAARSEGAAVEREAPSEKSAVRSPAPSAPLGQRPPSVSSRPTTRAAANSTPTQPARTAVLTKKAVEPISAQTLEKIRTADWEQLAELANACRACEMGATRQHVAFSDGVAPSGFVLIGEAPGREEDLQGKPFVGNSGQLLTAMLAALGISRPNGVTIINVLKCRPPENRDPQEAEVEQCSHFLERQLKLLAPSVVLLSGRHATMAILGLSRESSISSMRGRVHDVHWRGLSFKAVVTFHPSYLLRRPMEKVKAWEDLLLLKTALEEAGITAHN